MGRQAYMNRLALGRSPYEPPDLPSNVPPGTLQARASAVNTDGYIQQYDERGHAVNPASKSFGRELRRAKNDVLSTMGIVVSGEDGNLGISKERQKINLLTAENDYGLVMATFDQALNFLGSWWTLSLGGRIQTYKSYTHVPLMRLIRFERRAVGLMGFYFAGIPAWATAFTLSIFRNHLLEPLMVFLQNQFLYLSDSYTYSRLVRRSFSVVNKATRAMLFLLFEQTYMFSILQALHLTSPFSFPGLRFFLPFSESSLIQLPPLPVDFSPRSLGEFVLNLAMAPFSLVYLYICLRPIIEARIYRILRRRLPKPDRPDELSIRVAVENDLIEWTVPTLGRRSEEEIRRSNFSMLQEIRYELLTLRNWVFSWFGWKQARPLDGETINPSREERIESLRHRIEQLQHELGNATSRVRPSHRRQQRSLSLGARGEQLLDTGVQEPRLRSPGPTVSTQTPEPESLFNMDQVLSDEHLTHSPGEISPNTLDELPPSRPAASTSDHPQLVDQDPRDDIRHHHRRDSRSNTLFSRPSSPESSPPTSPRVRASLVHQNSEVITMQLELLTNRNPNRDRNLGAAGDNSSSGQNGRRVSLNRSASELLDAILSNPDRSAAPDALRSESAGENDVPLGLAAEASPAAPDVAEPVNQNMAEQQAPEDVSNDNTVATVVPENATILPDGVEEPTQSQNNDNNPGSDSESEYSADADSRPLASRGQHRRRQSTMRTLPTHRVTILSSHPVDSLASHLASLITSVLFIPLESLYLRSLAMTYLSLPASAGTANLASLRSDIRSLNAWAGGGGRQDVLAYMGKLALVTAMQAAVSMGILRVGAAAAVGLGKRVFGWGNL
ncbi:hypothetical protein VTN77DRAFT_5331 [Rasamsonia byssochlamydoides]|uniref:uncharacterized protein n=1 Tax=Rasamsonia byssochlamydoides TaxID=89139 RepID=UPI0037431D09